MIGTSGDGAWPSSQKECDWSNLSLRSSFLPMEDQSLANRDGKTLEILKTDLVTERPKT